MMMLITYDISLEDPEGPTRLRRVMRDDINQTKKAT